MTCKTCGGSGEIGYTENQSPLGSGEYWPMYMTDVCPDCVEKGICPRCDIKMDFNNEKDCHICPKCGYNESEGVA